MRHGDVFAVPLLIDIGEKRSRNILRINLEFLIFGHVVRRFDDSFKFTVQYISEEHVYR